MTCLDAKTGEVKYEGGRRAQAGHVHGVAGRRSDGRMFWSSEDGDTFVIKTGPDATRSCGTNSLGEPIVRVAGHRAGRIYIRGARHLFAIGS